MVEHKLICAFAETTISHEKQFELIDLLVNNTSTPKELHMVIIEAIVMGNFLGASHKERIDVYPTESAPHVSIKTNGGYHKDYAVLETKHYDFYIYRNPKKGLSIEFYYYKKINS